MRGPEGRGTSRGVRMSEVRKAASMDFDHSRNELSFMSLDYQRGANYRSGTAGVGRRISKADAAAGVGAQKKVRPTRTVGRRASGMQPTTADSPTVPSMASVRDESKCPISPSLVGKADEQQSRASRFMWGDKRYTTGGVIAFNSKDENKRKAARTVLAHRAGYGLSANAAATGAAYAIARRKLPRGHVGRAVIPAVAGLTAQVPATEIGTRAGERKAEQRGYMKPRVSKAARYYDPESARQHRMGVQAGALGTAGGLLVFRGARGARGTTKVVRGLQRAPGKTKTTAAERRRAEGFRRRGGVAVIPNDIAQLAGGGALLGGSGAIANHMDRTSNRKWR